ncbi:MAG TPA: mechanosensitive ion channel [Bacteroidales bacterium]|nr:mechanosensitive ion channel [Bacteroidales bacterium]HNS46840.1 mechanosensitive ion channel [Bacteroidales bacterium]
MNESSALLADKFDVIVKEWLLGKGLTEYNANLLKEVIEVLVILLFATIAFFIIKKILIVIFHRITKKTPTKWDDILFRKKFFNRLSYLIPAYIVLQLIPLALTEYSRLSLVLIRGVEIYMLVVTSLIFNSFLNSADRIYQDYEMAKSRPIKGYLQVAKMVIYIIIGILIFSILIGKSPIALLAGMGAISAVLMLIFKDPILGFVGGIQLAANDMLHKGDWITMSKYGADGTVQDISLTTVKIQNFDKTIVTVPTYSLVSDSFQNWRGMEDSGVRRIKRSVYIDIQSIKFCTPEMLGRFRKFQNVAHYVDETEREIQEYNRQFGVDPSALLNGRRQTNIGVFRAYLLGYLRNNDQIDTEMTMMVRQLQPTDTGLPIEIYAFSRIQEWVPYENIQSDIFDHVLAAVPLFDLQVFQNPTGSDFRALKS